MDKKLLINYFYNILFQVVRIILPMFLVPYTHAVVTTPVLGINDLAGSVSSLFILFGIVGINVYGNREIAKVRDNKQELSRNFWEILSMQVVDMALISLLYFCYVHFFVAQHQTIWLLHLLLLVSSAFDITWFYFGVEDFKAASIRNVLVKLLGVLFIFLLVKTPQDLWLFVLINALSEIFGQLIMFIKLKQYISWTPFSLKEAYRHHFLGTLALFIPTIAINIYTLLDQLMLGYLTNDLADLNLYKTAQSFVKMFLYFITSIGTVILPRVSNIYYNHKDGKKEVARYISTTFKIALILAIPMSVGMFCVSPSFFPWYFRQSPNDIERMILLVQVSSSLILFISLSNVFGIQYLVPTGRVKQYTLSVISGAVVNFGINIILIPLLKGAGAAIASIIAELTVTLVQYHFVKQDIKLNAFASLLRYLLASFLMGMVVIYIGSILKASLLVNVLQATVGGLIYLVVLLVSKEALILKLVTKVRNYGSN